MNILFMGDYSGYHATLAKQLTAMGHNCVVVSEGSRVMDTARDIDLKRKPGFFNSVKYLAESVKLVNSLKGFDVVQFINPGYLHLRPGKLKYLFKTLKKNNGTLVLSMAGTDSLHARSLLYDNLFRYSEYLTGDKPTPYAVSHRDKIDSWLQNGLVDYCKFFYDSIDGAVTALYEYQITGEKNLPGKPVVYGGIPIDVGSYIFKEFERENGRHLNILVAIKSEMMEFKGTDRLLSAARKVETLYPDKCKVTIAQDMKLTDYLETVDKADVVLDQIYSYTPATNALQSMAKGKIVISGGESEYYDFIGETELRPIVNAIPDDTALVEIIEKLVLTDDNTLKKLSQQGRKLVEKHNSSEIVAQNFLKAWEKMMK